MFHFGRSLRWWYLPHLRFIWRTLAASITAASNTDRFMPDDGQLPQLWRQTPPQPPSSLQK